MAEKGLPMGIKMRHDTHYVDELSRANRTVGRFIPIDRIKPNPGQPRTESGDLEELSASIVKQGVLEPLLVKPLGDGRCMIIAGERRWRASKLAGLSEVPCIELDIAEKEVAEVALVENLQRKDLTIWEVADALLNLNERFGYTHDEIAEKIGKSRSTVTESMAIASMPERIRKRCVKENIDAKSILVEISRQFDEKAMEGLLDEICREDLKRTDIRERAKPDRKKPSTGAKPLKKPEAAKKDSGKEKKPKSSFSYKSSDSGFHLSIEFEKDPPYNRKDVLLSLKEVFDNVKSKKTI